MDFHNDVRVHVIPETEEFIKTIGHMATEEDIMYLQVRSSTVGGVLSSLCAQSCGKALC